MVKYRKFDILLCRTRRYNISLMTAYWQMAVSASKFEIQVCKGSFTASKERERLSQLSKCYTCPTFKQEWMLTELKPINGDSVINWLTL